VLKKKIICEDVLDHLEECIELSDELIAKLKARAKKDPEFEKKLDEKLFEAYFDKGKFKESMKTFKHALECYFECNRLKKDQYKVFFRIAHCYKK